jgi:HlyD family secretion protein
MGGLVENDKVVTSGAGRLQSGMEVSVQDILNKNGTDNSGGQLFKKNGGEHVGR